MCARRYDEAIQVFRFSLDLEPSYSMAHLGLGRTLELKGQYEDAMEEFRKAYAIEGSWADAQRRYERLKSAYAAHGVVGYWREDLAIFLEGRQPDSHYGTTDIAQIYMRLGDREHAIQWLQTGYAVHDPYLIFNLLSAPELEPIRSDPRVIKMLQALGIPS
jgi:tetratricopeptide (TPR) repeat protein